MCFFFFCLNSDFILKKLASLRLKIIQMSENKVREVENERSSVLWYSLLVKLVFRLSVFQLCITCVKVLFYTGWKCHVSDRLLKNFFKSHSKICRRFENVHVIKSFLCYLILFYK